MSVVDPTAPVIKRISDIIEIRLKREKAICAKHLKFHIDSETIDENDEIELRCIKEGSQYPYEIEFPPRISVRVNNFPEVKLEPSENPAVRRKDSSFLLKEDLLK